MSVSDPISDMLTRLRNATRAGLTTVIVPHSKLKAEIARILQKEGFVGEIKIETEGVVKNLRITLRYAADRKTAVLRGLRRVSKPGLRKYVPADGMPRVLGGMGMAILSTSKGLLSDRDARRTGVGGEVLCYIW